MSRWTLVGCMALAAMGAAAVLDAGLATAEAAPSSSQFAGTYAWSGWPVAITISDGGRIASSWSSGGAKGTISGRVSADRSYSFTASVTYPSYDDGPRDPRVPRQKYVSEYAGIMESDAAGNIVGTTSTGGSFVWLRQ